MCSPLIHSEAQYLTVESSVDHQQAGSLLYLTLLLNSLQIDRLCFVTGHCLVLGAGLVTHMTHM